MVWRLFLIGFFILTLMAKADESKPPPTFIDKGACPVECCKYGQWTALKDFSVFDKPDQVKKIGTVKKGEKFTGVYGEVHVTPFEVKLTADDDQLKEGETVYLLNYRGKGFYRAWHRGKVVDVFDGSTDLVEREKMKPRSQIWNVQIRLTDGRMGWIKEAGQFDPANCAAK